MASEGRSAVPFIMLIAIEWMCGVFVVIALYCHQVNLMKSFLSMSQTSDLSRLSNPPANAKLARVACDQCHRCKLRCTRELPRCERCSYMGSPCTFSTGKPIGKPRGRKNKNSRTPIATRREKQDQTGEPTPRDQGEHWLTYHIRFNNIGCATT
jgi:Fungal Zn(2)-Cys(6) binuclear cluster domain